MTTVAGETQINASKEKVWAVLADLRTVRHYDPGVISAHYTSESREGVGATRHCGLPDEGYVEERITGWKSGEGYTISVYEGSEIVAPFATQDARFTLTEDGQETTVRVEIEYELKSDAQVNSPEVERQWGEEMIPTLLAGLKHYVETGEPMPMPEPADVEAAA